MRTFVSSPSFSQTPHVIAFWALGLLASVMASLGEIDASRDTMPKQFQGAPGLIKGGFLIEGSKKRFEGANELNLESFKTKLEITPGELSLKRIS